MMQVYPSRNISTLTTWYLYIITVMCGIAYSVTASPIFGYISTIICCYVMLRGSYDNCYLYLMGSQFLRAVSKVKIGDSELAFLLFAYLVLLSRMFLVEKRKVKFCEVLVLLLLAVDIISGFAFGIIKIGDNVAWSLSAFFTVVYLGFENKRITRQQLLAFFLPAVLAICIVNILAELRIYGKSLTPSMYGIFIAGNYFSFGKAYSSIAGGNGIALDTVMAIAACIITMMTEKTHYKAFLWIASAFFVYCGMICIARAFYIELVIFIVLLMLGCSKRPGKLLLILAILFGISASLYARYYDRIEPLISNVLRRFMEGNEDRGQFLDHAAKILKENLYIALFGASSYYPEVFGFTAHNIFYDSAVSLGYLGAGIYWIVIVQTVVKNIRKVVNPQLLDFIPLIMMFSYKMISGSIRDVSFYYFIGFVVLFATQKRGATAHESTATNSFHARIQ